MLISNDLEDGLRIYIIDWELARCARPELDVGSFAMMSWAVAHRYPAQDCYKLIQEFHKSYRKYLTLDAVHVARWSATDVMGFGTINRWAADRDERTLEGIARCGVDLMEAARERDTEFIKRSAVLQAMYAV